MFEIRQACKLDCKPMLDIYTPIIEKTATSFELEVPSVEQFQARVSNIQNQFPWLVCTKSSQLAGYAYAGPHRSRSAYQWSAELSVYIDPKFHRLGIGRALYSALIEILKLQGYYTVLAGISLPNETSVHFHESFGFTPVGIYHNIGYKFKRWHSVGWWELAIKNYQSIPQPPVKVGTVMDSPDWSVILSNSATWIDSNS